jgi:hypothetical protein
MKKPTKLQAAYDKFARQVGRMLVRKGATYDTISQQYTIDTPGGPLTIRPSRNWLFCHFHNPLGGYIVTNRMSAQHSGKWNTNFPDDADSLTRRADYFVSGFEYELDQVLAYTLNDEQREQVRASSEAYTIQSAKLDVFLAAAHARGAELAAKAAQGSPATAAQSSPATASRVSAADQQ